MQRHTEVQKNRLNEIAVSYHQSNDVPDKHIEELGLTYLLKWILQEIPPQARVLEMGYGDGIITKGLVEHKVPLTVIEGASVLCSQLKTEFPEGNPEIVHALFEEFSPERRFDVVLASHVLEHVDNPKQLLMQVYQWLNPGGLLIVVVPNRESIHRQLAVLMNLQPKLDTLSPRDLIVGHQRVYDLNDLKQELNEAAFNVIKEDGFFLKPLPNSMMLGYSEPLLRALHDIGKDLPKHLLANIAVIGQKK